MSVPSTPVGASRAESSPNEPANERALLARLIEGPIRADTLAGNDGPEGATLWQRVQDLQRAGVPIDEEMDGGYRLTQPFDLLDNNAIVGALPASVRARMASLEVAWIQDSTNSELQRRPAAADGAASVLLAERQTGGRGRRGKEWSSPLGAHVYLSLARTLSGDWTRLGGLSLVAGVATVEALHALGYGMVRLKWPNDLVVPVSDGGLRKLGGLLVDGGGDHAGTARAVIGLGLNVRMPERFGFLIDQPWCDLAQLPVPTPSRSAIAAAIIARWVPALDEFDRIGLSGFLTRYAAMDAIAGQPVRISSETSCVDGVALGLAGDGSLRVRTGDGAERCFHAGEVSVRRVEADS
ncbi:biotin--[acetyl-CoA-carboxylase] ligase [Lysobacter sp. A03]|uniref:biotin--[acetyl-CoA-carboxylase] ligase n=1 Tax=Lysobacter sp. A03 TaxID=1199154 RepID=UPI0005B70A8E|nr:biotin--[acetyl-CoA-carboxylase] ligase [Lysobacter sp. A03]KIQ96422.1 Biotin-protein ligase [Lysobacter sp. A03]